jgi:hypothetical protein
MRRYPTGKKMFEFHGWATIRFTPENRDRDDEEALQEAAVNAVRAYIEQMGWDKVINVELQLRIMNGKAMLWTAGFKNRPAPLGQEPIALFRHIAQVAPSSYGLLYTYDDEDVDHQNVFRVYLLARGSLTERSDPFLSPFVPTVEDTPEDIEQE